MTYALVIPPQYLGDLVKIREKTKTSIRKQILQSIEKHIAESKKTKNTSKYSFSEKEPKTALSRPTDK